MNEQMEQKAPWKGWWILWQSLLWLVIGILALNIFVGPAWRYTVRKGRVSLYVLTHQDKLNEFVTRFEDAASEDRSTKYKGFRVFYSGDDGKADFIGFERFGGGFLPDTWEAGMFYSPDDTSDAFLAWFYPDPELLMDPYYVDTSWMDNSAITEKLCDHWYWYYVEF